MLAAVLLALSLLAPPQGRDAAAVDAYRRGDYPSARSAWLPLLEEPGLSSAERGRILYDLGNVAFREGKVLEAVGWYTASLRLRPRDAETWTNLEHARTVARLEPADRGDLAATVWRLLSSLTRAESEWLALGGAALWALALAAEALRGGRALRRLALFGAFIALASLAPWLYHLARDGRDTVMVVEAAEGGAEVRSEPRPDAAVIATVPAGAEIERLDELPGWVKVEASGGAEGWVKATAVFPLQR